MTGEELNRKYWEMKGYWADKEQGSTWFPAPPLHLDANLAIAEADRVFVEWIFTSVPSNKSHRVNAYWERNPDTGFYKSLEVHGETFCEAILKALIAAGGK